MKKLKKQNPPEQLKVYELYCNGEKIGSALYEWEVKEMKREYRKNYSEMGRIPHFECIEV